MRHSLSLNSSINNVYIWPVTQNEVYARQFIGHLAVLATWKLLYNKMYLIVI